MQLADAIMRYVKAEIDVAVTELRDQLNDWDGGQGVEREERDAAEVELRAACDFGTMLRDCNGD